VQIDGHGEGRLFAALRLGGQHGAHVRLAGQAEQAAAILQGGGQLGRRHADVLFQPEDQTGSTLPERVANDEAL